MDPLTILRIAELAIGIAKNATERFHPGIADTILADIAAFEEIAVHVAQQHFALAGKPLDLSLLTHQERIP